MSDDGAGDERTPISMRRAETARNLSGHSRNRLVGKQDLVGDSVGTHGVKLDVRVRVISYLLSGLGHRRGGCRMAYDMLADHEECRGGVFAAEYLEDAVGHARVRAIVEREERDPLAGSPPDDRTEHGTIRGIRSPEAGAEQQACSGRGDL